MGRPSVPPTSTAGFRVENDGTCEVLTFDRPLAANAIDRATMRAFASAVDDVETRLERGDGPRGVVIASAPRPPSRPGARSVFLSGADLGELATLDDADAARRFSLEMTTLLRRLRDLPTLVVAAIHGDVYGGGCELITACDLRVAQPGIELSFKQTRMGLSTGWGGSTRLVQLVGLGAAKRLLLTGMFCTAEEALRIGLVDELADDALARAKELVHLSAEGGRFAVKQLKRGLHDALTLDAEASYARELDRFVEAWGSGEHAEALAARREKRHPRFR